MRGNRTAEMPVRHRTLAPCVGIIRIRFKGSSESRTSQPWRLPRTNFANAKVTSDV